MEFCRCLLTPSSLPPTSRFLSHLLWVPLSWLTIRTTRTSNLLQHPLPSPPLSSLYNKTFNSLCRRSLVTKTNFSLSLDCRQQKVTSVRRLSHFLVIPTSKLLSRKCVGRFAFPCVKRSRCPPFLFHSCVSTGSSKRRSPRWRYQGRRPAYLC